MKRLSTVPAILVIVLLPALITAQSQAPQSAGQPPAGEAEGAMKIGVIDIDRVAAESGPGKALLERLKQETEKINAERARREQEISDLQAKMTSEVLSAEARDRLTREVERKRIDAQRWLEDAQRTFQEKQAQAETEFQNRLRPVVAEVAGRNGFGLILRADPGLTMVLNPNLDITSRVIEAFNKAQSSSSGSGEESGGSRPDRNGS